jgi:hypothetical protein
MNASHRNFVAAAAAVLVTTALASGGCSAPASSNADSVPASRFAAAYAQALCTSLTHCCDENRVAFSFSQCTTTFRDLVDARLADPVYGANYDSKIASSCLRAVGAAESVTCAPDPGSISDARAVCQQIFVGKKAVGERCTSSAECAPVPGNLVGCEGLPIADPDAGLLPLSRSPGLLRPLDAPLSPPQCVAFPPIGEGSKCGTAALRALCDAAPGLYCDATDSVCKKRGAAGLPCSGDGCLPGLFCAASVCTPKVGAGEACTSSAGCAALLRCDAGGKTCVARKQPFEACTADSDCTIGVCDVVTRVCLKNAIATSATCGGKVP